MFCPFFWENLFVKFYFSVILLAVVPGCDVAVQFPCGFVAEWLLL